MLMVESNPRDFAGVNGIYIILCLFILIIISSYHMYLYYSDLFCSLSITIRDGFFEL